MADSMNGKSGSNKSPVGIQPATDLTTGDSADHEEDRDSEEDHNLAHDSGEDRDEPTYAPEIAGTDLEVSANKYSELENVKSVQSKSLKKLKKLVRTSC